jgi:hypothetical protein
MLPNIKPLFRIIQHQYVERGGTRTRHVKTATELIIPFFREGALQQLLVDIEQPTPTTEDQSVLHQVVTYTPPEHLLIYVQRQRPDGTVCNRSVGYGQRLLFHHVRYGFRGAVHHHPGGKGHYTSVVSRGDEYYHCNDTLIKPLTRQQAFGPYTFGSTNAVQLMMYSRLPVSN